MFSLVSKAPNAQRKSKNGDRYNQSPGYSGVVSGRLSSDCPFTRCCSPQLMARAERRPRYSWCLRKYPAMGFPALDMVERICATWTSGSPVIHYGSPYLFFEVNSVSAMTAFFRQTQEYLSGSPKTFISTAEP